MAGAETRVLSALGSYKVLFFFFFLKIIEVMNFLVGITIKVWRELSKTRGLSALGSYKVRFFKDY